MKTRKAVHHLIASLVFHVNVSEPNSNSVGNFMMWKYFLLSQFNMQTVKRLIMCVHCLYLSNICTLFVLCLYYLIFIEHSDQPITETHTKLWVGSGTIWGRNYLFVDQWQTCRYFCTSKITEIIHFIFKMYTNTPLNWCWCCLWFTKEI